MSAEMSEKTIFEAKLQLLIDSSNDRSFFLDSARYETILSEVKEAQQLRRNKLPLSTKHYRRLKRYDVLKIGDSERLVEGGVNVYNSDGNVRYFCKTGELFDVLCAAHINTGHKRMRAMEAELKKTYCNVTRQVIDLYLTLCKQCHQKKIPKRGLVVRPPVVSNQMNSRCQVDVIDMQSEPDGDYKFILNFQDHLTKFTVLRPLKTNTAEEVAYQILDILCIFGAPFILQSDNGREFANSVITYLAAMWPGLKMVHGESRHPQSQGSVEISNPGVRDMLVAWMSDNDCKNWSEGLRFIQSNKNRSHHTGIKTSPYESMFGRAQRIGLADSAFPEDLYSSVETEEELDQLFASHSVGDNAKSSVPDGELKFEHGTIEGKGADIGDEDGNEAQQETEIVYCAVCDKESSMAHKCFECDRYVHIICGKYAQENEGFGQKLICNLCLKKYQMHSECEAEQVISVSNSRLAPVEIGKNVVVRVPDVVRGRLGPRTASAVVLDVNQASGLYLLGTKDGTLPKLYTRDEFTAADSNDIDIEDVPSTASFSNSGSQQEFISCSCKRYCIDKKCKCRSNNIACNSNCHSNSACKNK